VDPLSHSSEIFASFLQTSSFSNAPSYAPNPVSSSSLHPFSESGLYYPSLSNSEQNVSRVSPRPHTAHSSSLLLSLHSVPSFESKPIFTDKFFQLSSISEDKVEETHSNHFNMNIFNFGENDQNTQNVKFENFIPKTDESTPRLSSNLLNTSQVSRIPPVQLSSTNNFADAQTSNSFTGNPENNNQNLLLKESNFFVKNLQKREFKGLQNSLGNSSSSQEKGIYICN
jgi:hypothetical protein